MRVSCLFMLLISMGLACMASRIREYDITLPVRRDNLEDVPIIDPPRRVAGYYKLKRTYSAEMFFFYFEARHNPSRAPLVIWMTGGPGCSSELAILYENGPFNLDKEGVLSESAYGWDQYHNMIFVDQPIGTGFSYSEDDRDRVHGEVGVANDMLDFVYEFLERHDDLKDRPLFITGESYAGHYVPAVSHRIWMANKNKEGPYIHLQGLAVGNGLTDPAIQFNAYGDYAVQNKLIGSTLRAAMSFFYPLCNLANTWCQQTGWDLPCVLGLQYCMATQFQPILASNPMINVYDITKQCEGRLCYDFTAADKFLNDPETRKMLGVGDRLWVSCAMDVYEDMASDWLTKYDDILPEMMADGVRVMIYAGDLDLICNYLGNRRWVDAMEWKGAPDWAIAEDMPWEVNGMPAGTAKQVGPLSFVRVAKAGHMVPMDQPLNALAMITAWTRNLTLARAHHITPLKAHALHGPLDGVDAPAPAGDGASVAAQQLPEGAGAAAWHVSKQQPHRMQASGRGDLSAKGEQQDKEADSSSSSSRTKVASPGKGLALSASLFVRNMAKMVAAHTKQAYTAVRFPLRQKLW